MASIFELGDIPGGLLPGQMGLAAPTATATLSTADSFNAIIRGVPTAAATYTTATAAAIVAAIGGDCAIGTTFMVVVINASAGANTITIAGGTGVTVSGVATVVQNASKEFLGRVTAVAAGSEAITLYGLGSTAAAAA
jgi:ABC-type Fe3+ transport system substrate-binding protein